MIHQLRIYEIFEDNKAAFHERFRDHAMRIMAAHGFRIVAIWEARRDDDRTELVYLLEWDDAEAMAIAWAAFMDDQEWKDIKRDWAADHGQALGEIEDRVLMLTDYTPPT
jgi:heme-degrading monooxygenase HmoA